MARFLMSFALCAVLACCAIPAFAAGFYEDPATGQLYTRPAEGRVQVAAPAGAGTLYEDVNGQVYTKPGEGRTAIETQAAAPAPAVPAAAVVAPAAITKEEVFAALPDWMQRFTFVGDLRIRYQWQKDQTWFVDKAGVAAVKGPPAKPAKPGIIALNDPERQRARIRFRPGFEYQLDKTLKICAGAAIGNWDKASVAPGGYASSRSTNDTFGNYNAHAALVLDYAYFDFTPWDFIAVDGGVIKNPIYTVGTDVWDSNIRPEGGAVKVNYPVLDFLNLQMNDGIFVLNEVKSGSQTAGHNSPFMYVIQPGVEAKPFAGIYVKAMADWYGYESIQGQAVDSTVAGTSTNAPSNTRNPKAIPGTNIAAGTYKYNYDAVGATAELGYNNPVPGIMPYAGFFGDFQHNVNVTQKRNCYLVGAVIGNRTVKKGGEWQALFDWRRIEKDSIPDFLPDSDFYNGQTGVQGTHLALQYGLMKNTAIGVTWFRSANINPNDPQGDYGSASSAASSALVPIPHGRLREDLVQADLMFYF